MGEYVMCALKNETNPTYVATAAPESSSLSSHHHITDGDNLISETKELQQQHAQCHIVWFVKNCKTGKLRTQGISVSVSSSSSSSGSIPQRDLDVDNIISSDSSSAALVTQHLSSLSTAIDGVSLTEGHVYFCIKNSHVYFNNKSERNVIVLMSVFSNLYCDQPSLSWSKGMMVCEKECVTCATPAFTEQETFCIIFVQY